MTLIRSVAIAALGLAAAACGGGDGGELAAGNSQLSQAQIDAALGPADQTMAQDAFPGENLQNDSDPAGNAIAAAENETER